MSVDPAIGAQKTGGHGSRPFRALISCAVFEPGFRGGGPIRSVAQIVDTVSDSIQVTLLTRDRDLGAAEPYPSLSGRWVDRGRARVFYLDVGSARQWLRLLRELRPTRYDVLYVNSLWSPLFTVVPVLAARLGLIDARAVLIAPRGELSPGALALKALKKRIFLTGWSRLLRGIGVVWHASTEKEAAEIRAVLPWATVETVMNQVALPRHPAPPIPNPGPARLVFIGRIAAMKNLRLTLEALRGLTAPIEFDIFGPVEDPTYWRRCQALIAQLPNTVRVHYRGELAPAEVRGVFGHYDAFVFPTLGENFGHIIAESLSASCPVICSGETPWTPVLEAGGGTVIEDLAAESLHRVLAQVAAMEPTVRLQRRLTAGDAYRAWRRNTNGRNVLDRIRCTRQAGTDEPEMAAKEPNGLAGHAHRGEDSCHQRR